MQVGAEHLAQQRVKAEPRVRPVERDQQHVGASEVEQRRGRALTLQRLVAELAAHPLERRGAPQEPQSPARRRLQKLLLQVVGDDPVVAGEPGQRPVEVRGLAQRQAGEVNGCRPALDPAHDHVDLARRELQPGRGQQRGALTFRHRQVLAAQLNQATTRPQPAEPQGRFHPARDRELRAGGHTPHERRDHCLGVRRFQPLQLVEDQQERLSRLQLGEQPGHDDVLDLGLRRPQRVENLRRDRLRLVQDFSHRTDQHGGVVLAVREQNGVRAAPVGCGELLEQDRLAVARRGAEDQRLRRVLLQAIEQPAPGDHFAMVTEITRIGRCGRPNRRLASPPMTGKRRIRMLADLGY